MRQRDWKAYYDYRAKVLGRREWRPGELAGVRENSSPNVTVKFKGETFRIPKAVVGASRVKAQPARW